MFSNDDNSGLVTFLACLIVVVLAGVFLSLVIDGNLRFSKSQSLLKEEVLAGASEVSHLSQLLSTLEIRLKDGSEARKSAGESLRATNRLMEAARDRKQALAISVETLKSKCAELDAGFSAYRTKYRENHWKMAVGRALGVLRLRGGREFRQVVITRVTEDGLEIRHESGTARLSALELDAALQDEFQWNAVEPVRAAGTSENRLADRVEEPARTALSGGISGTTDRPTPAPDEQVIAKRRETVLAWRTKLQSLRSQRAEAASRASYGGGRSVPGSLETWAQRATALASQIAKAEAEHARALSALALVAPDDPLLRRMAE